MPLTTVAIYANIYKQQDSMHICTYQSVCGCTLVVLAVRLRRTSRLQAAAALRRAQPWRPLLQSAPTDGDSPTPQAICGSNSLVADNSNTNCRIVTTYGNGVATSCSATKIGNNYLATAGRPPAAVPCALRGVPGREQF